MHFKMYLSIYMLLICTSAFAREIPSHLWGIANTDNSGFSRSYHSFHSATPGQPEGPFYPATLPDETDSDLTTVNGKKALGIPVYVYGHVLNTKGEAIPGAVVEVWQAGQSGSYNHPLDNNPAPRDPNFQNYARLISDSNGKYVFKTIVPGPYPASDNWMRPPHIHFKVNAEDKKVFITQLYFNGQSFGNEVLAVVGGREIDGSITDSLNNLDFLLKKVPQQKRSELVVLFNKDKWGHFDLYLENERNSEL